MSIELPVRPVDDEQWADRDGTVHGGDVTRLPTRPRLTLVERAMSRDDLDTVQPPTPLIPGVLDMDSVAGLVGDTGTLKSFLALDWAASVATGRPWHGRAPQATLRGLYLVGEGVSAFRKRTEAWERGWQQPRIGNDQLTWIRGCPHLHRPGEVDELADFVRFGGYQFVVIDTLSKAMPGMDENGAQDMSRSVESLYQLQEATAGGVVLACHHTGKDGTTTRGSSAFVDGIDTELKVSGNASHVDLRCEKRKDGPTGNIMSVRFREIGVSDGTSGVVENVTGDSPAERQTKAGELLELFREHFSATGASQAQLRNVANMPSATFSKAVNTLVSDGFLAMSGSSSRPFLRLK